MLLSRVVAVPNRAVAALACAFATHALVYGTLWPGGGAHAYFGWYEPLVAALSLASLAGLGGLLGVAAVARRLGRPLAGALRPGQTVTVRGLAAAALVVVVVQETVERSVVEGTLALPSFTPAQWLLALAGVASTALAVALVFRAGRTALDRLTVAAPPRARRQVARARWAVATVAPHRVRLLAGGPGLRGPPPACA